MPVGGEGWPAEIAPLSRACATERQLPAHELHSRNPTIMSSRSACLGAGGEVCQHDVQVVDAAAERGRGQSNFPLDADGAAPVSNLRRCTVSDPALPRCHSVLRQHTQQPAPHSAPPPICCPSLPSAHASSARMRSSASRTREPSCSIFSGQRDVALLCNAACHTPGSPPALEGKASGVCRRQHARLPPAAPASNPAPRSAAWLDKKAHTVRAPSMHCHSMHPTLPLLIPPAERRRQRPARGRGCPSRS